MDSPGKMMKFRVSALIVIFFITIGCPDKEVPQEAGFEAVNVSNTPYDSEYPTIAVGPYGNIYIFWEEWNPDSGGIYYTYRSPDGKWSEATFLCEGWFPCVRIDDSGTIHLAYQHDFAIHYTKKSPSGDWSPPEVVTALGLSTDPIIAVDKLGNIHLIWGELTGAIRIFYSKRSAEGSWSLPVELNREEAFHRSDYRIAVNAQGDAFVTWTNTVTDTGPDYILFTTNACGDTWSYPVPLNSNDSVIHFQSDIVVDSKGTIHVVWDECMEGKSVLYRYNEFGRWSEEIVLNSDSLPGGSPYLEIDEHDQLHLIYRPQIMRGTFQIYYRNKRPYGDWSERVFITDFGRPLGVDIHKGSVYIVCSEAEPPTYINDIYLVEASHLY